MKVQPIEVNHHPEITLQKDSIWIWIFHIRLVEPNSKDILQQQEEAEAPR